MTASVPYQPTVYRVYDKTDRLIYIGASTRLAARLNYHRTQSWWHALADRVEVEPHPTREAAFAAEAEAIRSEHPAFNLIHRGPRKGRLTDEDLRVCHEWAEAEGPSDRSSRMGGLPLCVRRLLKSAYPANVRSAAA